MQLDCHEMRISTHTTSARAIYQKMDSWWDCVFGCWVLWFEIVGGCELRGQMKQLAECRCDKLAGCRHHSRLQTSFCALTGAQTGGAVTQGSFIKALAKMRPSMNEHFLFTCLCQLSGCGWINCDLLINEVVGNCHFLECSTGNFLCCCMTLMMCVCANNNKWICFCVREPVPSETLEQETRKQVTLSPQEQRNITGGFEINTTALYFETTIAWSWDGSLTLMLPPCRRDDEMKMMFL